jgi:hypothetical protein
MSNNDINRLGCGTVFSQDTSGKEPTAEEILDLAIEEPVELTRFRGHLKT